MTIVNGKTVVAVQVSGPEHSGKTSVIAVLADMLAQLGIECVVQRADPQLDGKLENPSDALERCKSVLIKLTEMQTKL